MTVRMSFRTGVRAGAENENPAGTNHRWQRVSVDRQRNRLPRHHSCGLPLQLGTNHVRRPVESARAPPPLATSCRSLLIMTAPLASYRYHLLVSQSPLLHFSFSCRAEALREGGSEFLLLLNFSILQRLNFPCRAGGSLPRRINTFFPHLGLSTEPVTDPAAGGTDSPWRTTINSAQLPLRW
jgi:hypothetical protein